MSKVKNISGFPELLPGEKLLEDSIIESIKGIFLGHGFTPIETPAVELKSTLSSKGVIDKEIYLLRRALKDPSESDDEDLALHFDLTVPFARYVAQHFNDLIFPFKRYQIQKVWRGERPQRGRFREFYQFDIDIIARDALPIACDAEIISVIQKVFKALELGDYVVRINNRKILLGFYESLGLSTEQQKAAITSVDKLDKIGKDGIKKDLIENVKLSSDTVDAIIKATDIRVPPHQTVQVLSALGVSNDFFALGIKEVQELCELIPQESVLFDMSLARGLDYYTGTIYEVSLTNHPEFGTVSSGGRYEDLAGQFINKKLPGVGGSIGLSRLMDLIIKQNLKPTSLKSPTKLLITVYQETDRKQCLSLADTARSYGINTEVFYTSPKLGKQIDYADMKGIPYVLFYDASRGTIRVKDLRSKEEIEVPQFEKWCQSVSLA